MDDLDDGLEYDFNGGIISSDEGETHETTQVSNKKRHAESDNEGTSKNNEDDETKHLSKRQKKLLKSKFHSKKKEKMEFEKNQRLLLSTMSSEDIADNLNKMIGKWYPDMSPLELEELYFKKSEFISTSAYTEERTVEELQNFITKFSKAPKAIIFSSSNLRVADVFRNLNGSKQCLKLFSKNKLKEDLAKLEELTAKKNKDIKYFAVTPNRMEKIMSETDFFVEGKDKLDIIVDSSYLDPKTDTIFTSIDGKILCSVLKRILKNKSSVKILLF